MPRPGPRPELTADELRSARAMRRAGKSFYAVADRFGGTREWIAGRVDPRCAERRRARREQQHAEALARHRALMRTVEAEARAMNVVSRAEARRLHAKGVKRTEIAGLLRMRHAEVDAAIGGGA